MTCETIIGVDVAANKKAGENTWIAEGVRYDDSLLVRRCESAEGRFGVRNRSDVMDELVEMVKTSKPCIVGFDFPFGLPRKVLNVDSWTEFITSFEVESPDQLNAHYKSKANGEQIRRKTEAKTGGQCAYGYRIRYQTFYGIRDIIKPLVENDYADFPPMFRNGRDATVIETYPAATLKNIGGERQGYKKQQMSAHDVRRENVSTLSESVVFDESTKRYARADENALDALVAAYATSVAASEAFAYSNDEYDEVEGYLYAARP